jgi:hypothetical protein
VLLANARIVPHMNLDTARQHITACRERMDSLFLRPVFDEWVIVSLAGGKATVLDYQGPREDTFRKSLHTDSASIVREMQDRHYGVGDFEFVQDAVGSNYDACIRLGNDSYLLCNNLEGTMVDIRQDPRWRKAQVPFVDLTEKFRSDPLA